jgi:hypothetical protein
MTLAQDEFTAAFQAEFEERERAECRSKNPQNPKICEMRTLRVPAAKRASIDLLNGAGASMWRAFASARAY